MPSSFAKSDAAQTLNASAFTQLRSDIIACRLMPERAVARGSFARALWHGKQPDPGSPDAA